MSDRLDPCASRTVRPLKERPACTLPVIAIENDHALAESGQVVTLKSYIRNLERYPRHLVVTYTPETLLYLLHEHWKQHERWSWRVTTTTKHGRPLLRKRVSYYGFKRATKGRGRGMFHTVIDAGGFFRTHDKAVSDLLQFGIDLREWCNEQGIEVRPSAAGIATQLLRHPNFYPEPRRKVPTFINDEARPHLPGNHYDCFVSTEQELTACTYIDQQAAFHHAAAATPLPNSNSVLAHGFARHPDKPWARAGRTLYNRTRAKHGLVRAMVTIPRLTAEQVRFAPRLMQQADRRIAHLWTNELPYLESLGLRIEYITAVWGTAEVDNGIKRYAEWAQVEQAKHSWLKGLLLMSYGMLARHPVNVTVHHPRMDGTDPLILANQLVTETTAREVTPMPETINALQLGLIQAHVRALSLDMARQITANAGEVVSIYADGLFVRIGDGGEIPLITPWRIKEEYAQIELVDSLRFPGRGTLNRQYVQAKGQ